MIRFSAALVAVAIGVLIGGIATSKLLLVYIAIVVSAAALLTLAIGVVLKREELFGEGQGLVPAGAGAAPVLPAGAGETQAQPGQDASVPPLAPVPGPAASYGSAGQGRDLIMGPAPSWEAESARDQWSSPPWQGGPVVDSPVVESPVAESPVAESPVAESPVAESPVADRPAAVGAPDWMPGGWGANGPAAQAEESAPSSPAISSGAGPEPAPRSWFDRRPQPAEAAQPAAASKLAAVTPAGEDDDWPTRYSWLDDEPDNRSDESDTPASPSDVTDTQAGDAGDHPAPGASVPAIPGHDKAQDTAADDTLATGSAPPTVSGPAFDPESATGSAPPTVSAPAFDPESATGPDHGTDPEPEPVLADEPPAADSSGAAEADGLVAVLRGVPRYHQPDCVLIRFLPADDIRRLPVAQAKADGCTPCAACQPAE